MAPEIMAAINRFENALRVAVKRDVEAEMADEWRPEKLRRCDEAWTAVKAARVNLEAVIEEAAR